MTIIPCIDEGACAGHGDCAVVAPGVFRVDDVASGVGTATPELLREAADACPSGAISLFEEETGEPVYP